MKRNLSAGGGDVAGNGIPGDIPVHGFDDILAHTDRHPQMGELGIPVAAVEYVIGAHVRFLDGFAKLPHLDPGIVNAPQQHGLVEHRADPPRNLLKRFPGYRRDLLGGIDLGHHPQGLLIVALRQNIQKLAVHPLGRGHRDPGPQPLQAYVRYLVQFLQQPFQQVIGQHKRIAAGYQDIPDTGISANVVQRFLVGLFVVDAVFFADMGNPQAMGAVHAAHVGRLDGCHPGVELVNKPGRGMVRGHRGDLLACVVDHFTRWHPLQQDGVVDRTGHDQAGIIRGQAHSVLPGHALDIRHGLLGQIQDAGEGLDGFNGKPKLPAETVPVGLFHAQDRFDPLLVLLYGIPALDTAGRLFRVALHIIHGPGIGILNNIQCFQHPAADGHPVLIDVLMRNSQRCKRLFRQTQVPGRMPFFPADPAQGNKQVHNGLGQIPVAGFLQKFVYFPCFLLVKRLGGPGRGKKRRKQLLCKIIEFFNTCLIVHGDSSSLF